MGALKFMDYRGKPITACVTGEELFLTDAIMMEIAGISVFSAHSRQVADALVSCDGTRNR